MADYSTHKVPDLKKLLSERGLAISGNKADLIARLQEDDSKKAGTGGGGKFLSLSSPPFNPASAVSSFPQDANGGVFQQQEKMKSTGTKTTSTPLNPPPQPSQQAVKAPCQTPQQSRIKSLIPSHLQQVI
jgi:hypothetical protein